jgi:CheY-like chemotaxis protein/HAMP domain-containing protein/GAF domain-containing protein
VDVKGEILELKNTINTMVDQLSSFASEVTRVAREVGTEGKLGGQAIVKGVSGTWKDLTDNVNSMAANLTTQVRGIARVVTAVANGNLKRKLQVEALGEIAELADTINAMIDTLATFADQVTTTAREVGIEGKLGGQASVPGASGTWRDLTDNVNRLAANLTTQIRAMADVATAVTQGDLTRSITVEAEGEVAFLKDNVNEMIRNLRETTRKNTEQDWLKTNLAKFTRLLQGQKDLWTISRLILSELAPLVNVQHGVFYLTDSNDEEKILKLLASYAYRERKNLSNQFYLGEGLVGQCAVEKERILITNVPSDYITINSGLGEAAPINIVVLPVLFEGQVKAVIELASFHTFSETHIAFLDQLTESIGIVLNTIEANMRTESLLSQSQSLTQELQSQQEELTETNRRLELQAKSLQASEELLKMQQEELQQTNEELEEKASLLSEQKTEVERKNKEIELARVALEAKAEQLAVTSKYKSEFMANMSHELRTPLNSMLILSKMLADNGDANLSPKQVEFAETIYSSGADLLGLINEILDLSKIESGTMAVDISKVPLSNLRDDLERLFWQVGQEKGLEFTIDMTDGLPPYINTDEKRIHQVLKNLLSNAFKFTEKGSVTLRMEKIADRIEFDNEVLNRAETVIAFAVIDTGIGVPADKHRVIFEPFQQADGTTSRKYGGTGLGLSISREFARLLGGEIHLQSTPGEGSTFTLYLPQDYMPTSLVTPEQDGMDRYGMPESDGIEETNGVEKILRPHERYEDDRESIEPGDRVILIVEDDTNFAKILLDMAREKGFKGVISTRGETALADAHRYKPDAITLDIQLPGMHGLALLDRLKHDPATRHIPVHIVSVVEELPRNRRMGAVAHLKKPVTRETIVDSLSSIRGFVERTEKNLLVVEDDENQRMSITELVGGDDITITSVGTGEEALEALRQGRFDCTVLDLGLPDMTGFELIGKIRGELGLADLPIVVYTGRDLSAKEAAELNKLAEAVIVKDVRSIDKLLDETALFLHRVEADLPEEKRQRLQQLHAGEGNLVDRKVLIVDDDIRNIFALTSLLESYKMKVMYAESGMEAIEFLKKTPDIDVVLMDVMMPGMDGYETMRTIRKEKKLKSLPIIAVTAKAMKGDREKCIESGASDYITKPVDAEQLLSLLRVWINR